MCANCITNVDVVGGTLLAAAAAARGSVRQLLASAGVAMPTTEQRDARVVAFLRDLDLDPVAILGAETVVRADAAPAFQPTGLVAVMRSHARSAIA